MRLNNTHKRHKRTQHTVTPNAYTFAVQIHIPNRITTRNVAPHHGTTHFTTHTHMCIHTCMACSKNNACTHATPPAITLCKSHARICGHTRTYICINAGMHACDARLPAHAATRHTTPRHTTPHTRIRLTHAHDNTQAPGHYPRTCIHACVHDIAPRHVTLHTLRDMHAHAHIHASHPEMYHIQTSMQYSNRTHAHRIATTMHTYTYASTRTHARTAIIFAHMRGCMHASMHACMHVWTHYPCVNTTMQACTPCILTYPKQRTHSYEHARGTRSMH